MKNKCKSTVQRCRQKCKCKQSFERRQRIVCNTFDFNLAKDLQKGKKKKEEEMEKKKGETEAQYVAVLLFHNSSIHFLNFTSNSGLEPILAVVGWGSGVQPGHQSITGVFLL